MTIFEAIPGVFDLSIVLIHLWTSIPDWGTPPVLTHPASLQVYRTMYVIVFIESTIQSPLKGHFPREALPDPTDLDKSLPSPSGHP